MNTINISGLNKAEVLAALYNASQVQGMGFLQARPGHVMTKEEAQSLIDGETMETDYSVSRGEMGRDSLYFDYLYGKVMKIDLSKDTLGVSLYDRDNGHGAAYKALQDAGLIK